MCPTGALVYSFKSRLPDTEGVENIRVDTIHGVLAYKCPGADGREQFAPPSALRRIDLFLVDEASQYDDREWMNFFTSIREQPHAPYVVVVGGLPAAAATGRRGLLPGVVQVYGSGAAAHCLPEHGRGALGVPQPYS